MTHAPLITLFLAGSYVLGSMPFGLWIAWKLKGVDIRKVGSGNIGATNVGRICGPKAYSVVFVLDVLKGFLPPIIGAALHLSSPWQVAGAMLAIIGHNYSVFLGFQGGKGIATSLGALLGVSPLVGVSAFALFGVEMLTLRYVSVGSLMAAFSLPFFTLLYYPGDRSRLAFATLACLMAFYKHRANIARLRAGTEPRTSFRKGASEQAEPQPSEPDAQSPV